MANIRYGNFSIGFPLSLAFAVGSIIAIAVLQLYVHRYANSITVDVFFRQMNSYSLRHKSILDKPFLGGWRDSSIEEKKDLESKRESTKSVDSSSTDLVKEPPLSR